MLVQTVKKQHRPEHNTEGYHSTEVTVNCHEVCRNTGVGQRSEIDAEILQQPCIKTTFGCSRGKAWGPSPAPLHSKTTTSRPHPPPGRDATWRRSSPPPARPFLHPLPLWRQTAKENGGMSGHQSGHVNGYAPPPSALCRPAVIALSEQGRYRAERPRVRGAHGCYRFQALSAAPSAATMLLGRG